MLRKFRLEDIHKVLEIEKDAFPKTAYPKEIFLYYARRSPDSFVIIETANDIAGYIIFDMDGHIHSMAVKPVYRKKGFGRRLFMHASASAKRNLWLEVRSKNSGAIAFYERMGMRIIGKVANYYGNDDALIMAVSEGEN